MYSTIAFDFDGTIADSLYLFATIINQLAPEYGYAPIQDPVSLLRQNSARSIIQNLGISVIQLPSLIKRFKSEFKKQNKALQPIPGIKNVLAELKRLDYKLTVITSNAQETVQTFLAEHQMPYFDAVYSDSSIFGKSKVIQRFLKTHTLSHESMIYVGDEVRDIEAAHKSNISIIAVSWGYNNRDLLEKSKPLYLIDKPEDLIIILEDSVKKSISQPQQAPSL